MPNILCCFENVLFQVFEEKFYAHLKQAVEDFGGLVVRLLASGNRVRGFKPGRSRWIFRGSERICPMSPALWHVK